MDREETEYKPQNKEAPSPAIESGIRDDGAEVSEKVRKPRARDVARKAVERVKAAVEPVLKNERKPMTERDLNAAIALKDSQRIDAVKRYRKASRGAMRPAVRVALRQAGVVGASSETVDAIVDSLSSVKVFVGFRVDKRGKRHQRTVPVTDMFAYVFGGYALKGEDWIAEQWIARPTLFDVAVIGISLADAYGSMTEEGSVVDKAIKAAVEAHLKREAEKAAESTESTNDNATGAV